MPGCDSKVCNSPWVWPFVPFTSLGHSSPLSLSAAFPHYVLLRDQPPSQGTKVHSHDPFPEALSGSRKALNRSPQQPECELSELEVGLSLMTSYAQSGKERDIKNTNKRQALNACYLLLKRKEKKIITHLPLPYKERQQYSLHFRGGETEANKYKNYFWKSDGLGRAGEGRRADKCLPPSPTSWLRPRSFCCAGVRTKS